jgi:toxin ParE1/3/4
MRIRWTVPAADDLEGIWNYLRQHYPHLAQATMRTISLRVRSLRASPDLGRHGQRAGTRELVLTPLPYVVVYSVTADAVEILHIYHGAQDWR